MTAGEGIVVGMLIAFLISFSWKGKNHEFSYIWAFFFGMAALAASTSEGTAEREEAPYAWFITAIFVVNGLIIQFMPTTGGSDGQKEK